MPRLFTAIELPDDVRSALARLKQPLSGAKWVDPDHPPVRACAQVTIPNKALKVEMIVVAEAPEAGLMP